MHRQLIFFLFFYLTLCLAHGQDNFPESFFNAPKNIQIYIPSLACTKEQLQTSIIFKSYVGKLSIIRTEYADINININKLKSQKGNKPEHVTGVGFYSDKEGDFFSKTRVLIRYGLHIPLTEKLWLAGATAFHVINYNFQASGAGASGSDFNYSANVSTALYSSNFRAAISFNDLNNPEITPIHYSFTAMRYVSVFGEKKLKLTGETFLKASGRINFYGGKQPTVLAHLGVLFSRNIGITPFYYLNNGAGLSLDINQIKLVKDSKIDISFAYQVPNKKHSPPVNQYEINLWYYIQR